MLVLGLDISLNSTGYVVLEEDYSVHTYGLIQPKKLRSMDRLGYNRGCVLDLLNGYDIDSIVVEDYAFANANRAHQLGENAGVIRLAIYEKTKRLFVASPTTVKKYASGKGTSKKNEMLLNVYKNFGFETSDDNIADAYVLAHMGITKFCSKPVTKVKKECLEKIKKIDFVPPSGSKKNKQRS